MKKIYSFLLVLLMAGLSIGSAQASRTIASGDGWIIKQVTSDDIATDWVGKKILYISSDKASKNYASGSDVPWILYSPQISGVSFTADYSGTKRIGAYMFALMVKLEKVWFDWRVASDVTYPIGAHAFQGCVKLKELASPGANSIGDYAFEGCTKLEEIWAHPSITSIGAHAFEECTNFTHIYFFFGGTTRFSVGDYAFAKCSSLTYLNDDGKYITSVGEYGFANCALTSADLENCKTVGARAFNQNKLSYLHFGSAITSIGEKAFYYGLVDNGNIAVNRSAPPTTASDAFLGCNYSTIILDHPSNSSWNVAPWNKFKERDFDPKLNIGVDGTTLTLYYDGKATSRGYGVWNDNMWNIALDDMKNATKLVIDPSVAAARPTSTCLWFGNWYENLTTIEGIEYLNTSEVEDMGSMFSNCKKLKSIDVSHFNTSKCTRMTSMFSGCASLTELNVNNFDMSKVTSATFMFGGCTSLQRIYCEKDWTSLGNSVLYYAFSGNTNMTGGWGTPYDQSYRDAQYARPDGGSAAPGYFWRSGDTGEEQVIPEPEPDPEDTREVITTVALQGLDKSIFVVGASMDDIMDAISLSPVDEDAPYYMSGISLMKFDETTSEFGYDGVGETLEEGTYRLSMVVTIDGDEAEWYRFPDSDEDLPTVTLDGQTCFDRFSYVSSSDKESRVEFESPDIHVTAQGVENVQSDMVQSTKVLRDGILLIERNGKLYNAQGVEVK